MNCPECNSENIERYCDEKHLWQEAQCYDCHCEWQWTNEGHKLRIYLGIAGPRIGGGYVSDYREVTPRS